MPHSETANAQRAGIYQALLMKSVRAQLIELGRSLRIPMVVIKGAWSEPVLHLGRGTRLVSDIDVLVPKSEFVRVARALPSIGYQRVVFPNHRFSNDRAKEWAFASRDKRGLPIDLHRSLVNAPHSIDNAAMIARARPYESVDGTIVSLCPEDQVIYTAVHYANHGFALDGRHLNDTRLLVDRYPIDWMFVAWTCKRGRLGLAFRWLVDALRVDLPRRYRFTALDRRRVELSRASMDFGSGPLGTAAEHVIRGFVNNSPVYPLGYALSYAGHRGGDAVVSYRQTSMPSSARRHVGSSETTA